MKKCDFDRLLNEIGINQDSLIELALEIGLIKRSRLISASELLYSLCKESIKGTVSYNDIASQIETESGTCVSRQAIWKKITEPCLVFFKIILERIILTKMGEEQIDTIRSSTQFKRILIQDSTIIKLPVRLFKDFSGVANKCSKVCNARIQGVYDIMNEKFISFSIDPYSKNDLEAAPDLKLQNGDLSLRDRGYLINDEIQRHIDAGAHCIYRYKFGTMLLNPITEKPINLLKELNKKSFIDMEVKLNNKHKTIVRIVAFPVNDSKITDARRMKAKQEKKHHLRRNIWNYSHGQFISQLSQKNKLTIKNCSKFMA
jgi:hypothetical protein